MRLKNLLLFPLLLILLPGCNNRKEEVSMLTQENRTLSDSLDLQQETINGLAQAISQVERNVRAITSQDQEAENIPLGENFSEDVIRSLSSIDTAIRTSEQDNDAVRRRAAAANSRISQLAKDTLALRGEITDRDNQIGNLNRQITDLNNNVSERETRIQQLSGESEERSGVIEQQTQRMNTAFYLVGPRKELEADNVAVREGGFLFFGKVEKLKPGFNRGNFTQIDIREKTDFEINAPQKKVNLLTVHPPQSYVLKPVTDTTTVLSVTDPQQFWEVNNYLVVSTK